MHNKTRRDVLKKSGTVLVASFLGGIGMSARAVKNDEKMQQVSHLKSKRGINAFVVSADQEGICATCRFWGGVRRVTEDKKHVYCESLGWCSNPDSSYYQSKTTPVTGPMESWRKWEAL